MFSTSLPQIIYLFEKWSIHPRGESERIHKHVVQREESTFHVVTVVSRVNQRCTNRGHSGHTHISSCFKSSSLSNGWSMGVSISMEHQPVSSFFGYEHAPMSNDCFAMPRDASRPAKLPYIPSVTQSSASPCRASGRAKIRTGSVKVPPCGDVEYCAVNGEQDPASVATTKRLQRLRSECLEQHSRWVCLR